MEPLRSGVVYPDHRHRPSQQRAAGGGEQQRLPRSAPLRRGVSRVRFIWSYQPLGVAALASGRSRQALAKPVNVSLECGWRDAFVYGKHSARFVRDGVTGVLKPRQYRPICGGLILHERWCCVLKHLCRGETEGSDRPVLVAKTVLAGYALGRDRVTVRRTTPSRQEERAILNAQG